MVRAGPGSFTRWLGRIVVFTDHATDFPFTETPKCSYCFVVQAAVTSDLINHGFKEVRMYPAKPGIRFSGRR